MIIDIRCACFGAMGDIQIYVDEKIAYFARSGKKIYLFDKNSDLLIKLFKKGFGARAESRDRSRKKVFTVFKRKDSKGKVYYGIRPQNENRVFRVQTFCKDGVKYLLFTEDKRMLAAAKSFENERTLYKLYMRDENAELHKTFLMFVLHYCL